MGGSTLLIDELKERLSEFQLFFTTDDHLGTTISLKFENPGIFGIAYKILNGQIQKIEWFKTKTQNFELSELTKETPFIFHHQILNIINANNELRNIVKNMLDTGEIKT